MGGGGGRGGEEWLFNDKTARNKSLNLNEISLIRKCNHSLGIQPLSQIKAPL